MAKKTDKKNATPFKRSKRSAKATGDNAVVSTQKLNPADIPVTKTAPAKRAKRDTSGDFAALANEIVHPTQDAPKNVHWYETRLEAKRVGFARFSTEAEFRLINDEMKGWRVESATLETSERTKPTFEFFNVEDVRNAQLGSLYKAATAFGIKDVCGIKRAELIEIVLEKLRGINYNLERVAPEDPNQPTQIAPWLDDEDEAQNPNNNEDNMAGKTAAKKSAKKGATSKVAAKKIAPAKAAKNVPAKKGAKTAPVPAAKKGAKKGAPVAASGARVKQNGFTRPVPGSKTGRVWDVADQISGKEKRPARRAEVLAIVVDKEGGNQSMAATQYSRWRLFHGLTRAETASPSKDDAEVEE